MSDSDHNLFSDSDSDDYLDDDAFFKVEEKFMFYYVEKCKVCWISGGNESGIIFFSEETVCLFIIV